ncbi:uncharacterized protein LOC121856537 isoform X1 [Homarus americanus]|uniref:Putative centromere protein K-like n=1 Tax=Homarus americanus TaxID=6706 RepID=A0A8J5J981_HOMAM|nr:uncharacterized protein LOC121856537 isoform X1 [Homarus americanus]KAG7154215.1 putative centromere protein K-like [Homarus americanus]
MASGSENVDSARLGNSLEELITRIQEQLENLKEEVGESCTKAPVGNETDLRKIKMEHESEIEATMKTGLIELPADNQLLMRIVKEDSEIMAITNARTLSAYRKKVKELQKEKKQCQERLRMATVVNENLTQILKNKSEKDQLETLKRRFKRSAVVFKTLRSDLHTLLSEFYPEEDESNSMESLLERLVTQMLVNQNDPYIDIDDTTKKEHVALLLRANLIMRQQQNFLRIRFIDPRN